MRSLAIAATLAAFPLLAQAQNAQLEAGNEPRIVATVTRVAHVAPDRAVLFISVEATDEVPGQAVQRVQQKVQAITEAIRGAGVDGHNIQAVPQGLTPAGAPYGQSGQQAAHVARYVMRVASLDFGLLPAVASAAVNAGGSSAMATGFEMTAADSVREALGSAALADAQREAQTLAGSLGGRLGNVIEGSWGGLSPQGAGFVSFGGVGGPSAAPDVTVTVTATVRIQFLAQR